MAALLHDLAGPRGLVAHTGAGEFTVMLPGLDRRQAMAAIERVMGWPARVELDGHGEEILLVPRLQIECAGADDQCTTSLYEELHKELGVSRATDQHRLECLGRERARHSRPMILGGARACAVGAVA